MLVLDKWQYKVLTSNERDEWGALVESIPRRDVFFTPEYIVPFEQLSGERAVLFHFGDTANYIIYPFFRRRINDLSFYQIAPLDGNTDYFDIVSPYGYSGPVAHITDDERTDDLWKGFLEAFHHYCVDNNIICEFARLNPFVRNHTYLKDFAEGDVQDSGEIIYVDLTGSEEDIWRGLNRGNRSNINKAKRNGVEICRGHDESRLRRFYELYAATMHRNHANDWYYFSPQFFRNGFDLLGHNISLFCALYEGEIIAAASFVHAGDVVHYFLGSSDSAYLDARPNNLLLYEAISWAHRQGYRYFNLGGGYGAEDGLTRFKLSFSKQTATFYTYRRVHQPALYVELSRRHASYILNTQFFPTYRVV